MLFSVGFVLPCMLDITTTPDTEFMTFGKGTWLLIVGAFWVFGAGAWLIAGRPQRPGFLRRSNPYGPRAYGQTESFRRHPAAQAAAGYGEPFSSLASIAAPRPVGPDDDPDFLLELERRIRDSRDGS
ncbi:MAG: hypothetical protein ACLQFR_10050 [Streptosporangiaceae bacterium]